MPIDPSIVSGLAPAVANLSQMGTFAQQQTAAQSQREYRDKQRKEQQIAAILGSSADDDEKVNQINALDIELGSKFRTQLDTHREKARKLFSDDLANDKAKIQMAARLMQGVNSKPTMDAAKQMISALGEEGPQLAAMLPPEWDDTTSPALIKALVDKGMEAEQYTTRQQQALDRSIKGEWRHGLAEALATSDDPAEAQGALAGWKAMGAPKVDTEPFEALVANWSPDAKKKAGEMALTEQQRQTLAGQAEGRAATMTQQAEANRRADAQLKISQAHLDLARQANARAAAGKGDGAGGMTQADTDLVDAIIANPGLYDKLTPTAVGRIAAELNKRGFKMGQPLSNAAIKQIADSETAVKSLVDLREILKNNEQYIGPISGLQGLIPWSDARKAQSDIDRVKQRVGKALEGGVLRKEDEEKYKKILATLTDTPSTAIYKVDQMIKSVEMDVQNFKDQQRLAGRRVGEEAPSTYSGEVRQTKDGRFIGQVNGQVVELVKGPNGYAVKR